MNLTSQTMLQHDKSLDFTMRTCNWRQIRFHCLKFAIGDKSNFLQVCKMLKLEASRNYPNLKNIMAKKLGRIGEIKNLREIWANEASDFTKWLAEEENLNLLSEAVGVDLELIKTEADVGRYSVDILAKESNTERKVVIENQIEPTNHDHLGKVITYAAGHDAALAIWIVRDAKEEHAKAVEWLNDHTDDSIGFFLLEIKVLKIDDSLPAPQFKVIVKPNEWAKAIKADSGSQHGLTDTKQRQFQFWTDFRSYLKQKDASISCQTPRGQHWYTFRIGTSIAHISTEVNTQKGFISCGLYIPKNKELFEFLKTKKDEIEDKFGKCKWIDAKVASRILLIKEMDEVMSDNAFHREEEFQWFYTKLVGFKKVFSPMIKDFLKK